MLAGRLEDDDGGATLTFDLDADLTFPDAPRDGEGVWIAVFTAGSLLLLAAGLGCGYVFARGVMRFMKERRGA
ncbi:MAG: hypothetical protein M5R36_13510 [Deltaproteobacteria bacterium]|nr:hypothetical protein [Deltaproteobacteria bacterium]